MGAWRALVWRSTSGGARRGRLGWRKGGSQRQPEWAAAQVVAGDLRDAEREVREASGDGRGGRMDQDESGPARTLGVGGSRLRRRRIIWHTGGGARRAVAGPVAASPDAVAALGVHSRAPGARAPQPAARDSDRSAVHRQAIVPLKVRR